MSAATVIISGARVFDGESFLPRADVAFAGDTVLDVGPGLTERHPGARTVDATGKTVIPGIIDLHVHMTARHAGSLNSFAEPFSLQFYDSAAHLGRTLRAGVTSVRDAGGTDLGAKVAVESGVIPGPRLRIAVTIMSQTGGHGDMRLPSGAENPMLAPHAGRPSGVADGVEEVRKTVRSILRAGADQIKICSTGGVLSPADDPRHSQFTEDEIRVIVEEAAAQGAYVMAHAQGSEGIKSALRAGVRSIEHGIYLDEEAIGLLLDRGAYLVPTLSAPLAVIERAERPGSGLSQAVIDKAHRVVDTHRESVANAVAAGVKVAMGTDSGVGPHGENLKELALMADVGMGLEEVLRASTSLAGELIRNARVGRLAPGHAADAVVLDGELTGTARLASLPAMVRQVWKDGEAAFTRAGD
ncbi:amidohydrolase family protein [Nocardiopsis sp. DSM 44743]|uniref:Amidohydrolase family protein n=1 Tax=Nocardiopsis lambiniae TaxID=3075539 RepID=A0ABU2MAV2_9ACTN|nr:amidohydrolase family protein [Nocardiopsis sp. DSM 44743]MDT0329808.1 amidohydrolase family protein [Nocardiopsis sp. DSM 44743]